ncbi:hypothetical protein V8D89_011031 [Ganoderma adspersum]
MKIVYQVPSLGEGGFGRVYKARVLSEGPSRVIALKKSRMNNSVAHPLLLHEACGFVLTRGHPSIPDVFGWGRSQFYEYLAIELLGADLGTRLDEEGLTRGNFVSLVLQMFAAVKHVHSCGVIHCDIKPSNFVFGTGRKAGRIHLTDFNLWTTYRNFHTREHLPNNCATRGYRGTCHFASINCQLELPLSRRDDIESLAYTIFHIYADQLPWSHLKNDINKEPIRISDFKQVWHITHSFQGDCDYPLGFLIESSRSLQYDEEPDYDYWRRAFWEVDNPTVALPASDPMYDPEDETEELPRNMDFIREDPLHEPYDIFVVTHHMANRIVRAPGSNHGYLPVSSDWGDAHTMLPRDTMRDERGVIWDFVECITEVPTTTVAHLALNCPKEVMRAWDDPLPFQPVETLVPKEDSGGGMGAAKSGEQSVSEVEDGRGASGGKAPDDLGKGACPV